MSSVPFVSNNAEASRQENERQPLLKSLPQSTAGSLCTAFVVFGLVIAWCINDFWQRALNSDLFNIATMRATANGTIFHAFSYPLTLAFVEFAFTGLLFAIIYAAVVQDRSGQIAAFTFPPDRYWVTLVGSHVCGTFWLQSLIMPAQTMSLGLFAVSRAADIPMVTVMRSKVIGFPLEKRHFQTSLLACAAACTLFYSYAQLAGCVCIWSGNGVALTGLAFWIVYFLILALPAANAVCQEAMLVQREAHPLIILAVQNLFACLVLFPVVVLVHLVGWEDVGEAFTMIFAQKQILMIVVWLCVAMAATEAVCIMLISVTNSFWAVALRALRVVLWAGQMLMLYSLCSPLPLSITCPHSSLWALILTSGIFLAAAAVYADTRPQEQNNILAVSKGSLSSASRGDASKATGAP